MGMMSEHINRRPNPADLEKELLSLISLYNKKRNTFLIVFAGALNKPIPDVALCQEDYYFIADMLRTKPSIPKIDIYLETPGGSGLYFETDTAESYSGFSLNALIPSDIMAEVIEGALHIRSAISSISLPRF